MQVPQEQFQPAPLPDSMSASLAGMAAQQADLLRWQLDLNDVCEEIGHYLRGEFLINNKWTKVGKAMMNEQGIRSIIQRIRPFVHKGIILGNVNEKEEHKVTQVMKRISYEIRSFIYLKHEEYEIAREDFDAIRYVVCFNIYFTCTRAINGHEKMFLRLVEHRFEQVGMHDPNSAKKGIMSKMLGM